MLDAILRMPVECWSDTPLDKRQRHARCLEAADLIEDLTQEIKCSNDLLRKTKTSKKEMQDRLCAKLDSLSKLILENQKEIPEPVVKAFFDIVANGKVAGE
jgi:HAMP domain-containing protein